MMIVNYASSVINKLEALLTDDARVIIYDHHVFIVQATDASTTGCNRTPDLENLRFVFYHCAVAIEVFLKLNCKHVRRNLTLLNLT